MRRATNHTKILFHDDGEFAGICLGYDHTAEHEWGVDRMKECYGVSSDPAMSLSSLVKKVVGIPTEKIGLPARIVTETFSGLMLFEAPINLKSAVFSNKKEDQAKAKKALLEKYGPTDTVLLSTTSPYFRDDFEPDKHKKILGDIFAEINPYGDTEIGAAWDSREFAIRVRGENGKHLKTLFEAFKNKDVAFLGQVHGNSFIGKAGLTFAIASRLPQKIVDDLRDFDLEAIALKKADEATGIREKIEKANKRFYGLSPSRNKNMVGGKMIDAETKFDIIYWLNPGGNDGESGWYTVEDLEDWINGHGRVFGQEENVQRTSIRP